VRYQTHLLLRNCEVQGTQTHTISTLHTDRGIEIFNWKDWYLDILKRCEVLETHTHTQYNSMDSTDHIQTEVSIVYCKGNKYMNQQEMCWPETQCPLLRRFEAIYLSFDLEGWPWSSSLKMCSSIRNTCMPNIKLLSEATYMLWAFFET